MNKEEILTILEAQEAGTVKSDDTFEALNRSLLDSYNQEKYGTEEEGRSQVVASDHFDTVESDMPSLARIFLGHGKILHFKAYNEADKEEAEQKTMLADYYIRQQPDSFKILYDWLKEPGMAKCSVVKYYFEEKRKVHYETYKGLDIDELTLQMEDLEKQDGVEKIDVDAQDETGEGKFEVRFKITKTQKKIKIANVPIENFGITRNVQFVQDASLAFDICYKTKGELIADGYPKEVIKGLEPSNEVDKQMARKRSKDQGGYSGRDDQHWTNETVKIKYMYSLIDEDGDGIPERRMIVMAGEDEILEDIPYDRCPYAILTQIPMPHVLIGKSRGERAADIQKQKTAVDRGVMDNIYAHSRPRIAHDDSVGGIDGGKVDLDELMSHEIGGTVRTDGDPRSVLFPIVEPYIGSDALQVIQYLDSKKSSSLGTNAANQGLDSDKFYKETATRFEGIQSSSQAKIELVCRVFAEMGFRELYEGVIWTAQHYQDTETELRVLGKQFIVDPRAWQHEHYAVSDVGLGAGDSQEAIQNTAAVMEMQLRLADHPRFGGLIDAPKIYKSFDDMVAALGKPDVSEYANDPEIPEDNLQALLEQQILANQQMQQALQLAQNQISEAATIQAQAKLLAEKNKREIEASKLTEQSRQFDAKLNLDRNKAVSDAALEATKIEQEYNTNVPGALT